MGILLLAKIQVFLETWTGVPNPLIPKRFELFPNLVTLLDHSLANYSDSSMEVESPHSGPGDLKGRAWLRREAFILLLSIYLVFAGYRPSAEILSTFSHFIHRCFHFTPGKQTQRSQMTCHTACLSLYVPSDSQAWAFFSCHSLEISLLFGIC